MPRLLSTHQGISMLTLLSGCIRRVALLCLVVFSALSFTPQVLAQTTDVVAASDYLHIDTENELTGYKDLNTNTWVIPPTYRSAQNFVGNYAVAQDTNQLYGLIDKTGKWVIQPTLEQISQNDSQFFAGNSSGCAVLGRIIEGQVKLLSECEYQVIGELNNYNTTGSDGQFLVPVSKDHLVGYLDHNAKLTIPLQYQDGSQFYNKIALVQQADKWGMIDPAGKLLIPLSYDDIRPVETAVKVRKGQLWGLFTYEGKDLTGFIYDDIQATYEDFFEVQLSNRWGFIDNKGVEVIAPRFEAIPGSWQQDMHVAGENGLFGIINRQGEWLFPPKFTELAIGSPLFAEVHQDNQLGIIDRQGREIVPLQQETNTSWTQFTAQAADDLSAAVTVGDREICLTQAGHLTEGEPCKLWQEQTEFKQEIDSAGLSLFGPLLLAGWEPETLVLPGWILLFGVGLPLVSWLLLSSHRLLNRRIAGIAWVKVLSIGSWAIFAFYWTYLLSNLANMDNEPVIFSDSYLLQPENLWLLVLNIALYGLLFTLLPASFLAIRRLHQSAPQPGNLFANIALSTFTLVCALTVLNIGFSFGLQVPESVAFFLSFEYEVGGMLALALALIATLFGGCSLIRREPALWRAALGTFCMPAAAVIAALLAVLTGI
jgi:hypothetical protein